MKYFSMFSGIGGFELAIKRATDNQWTCVGFSEINKYAIETYTKNISGVKNYGDATKIEPSELPDFELLVGGFPCQAFSIAGKRLGFKDTRGTLFFEIARILKIKQPQNILLENVKGLLNHDQGRTLATIFSTLDELGYNAEWQVFNSKNYTGQNRERIYIFGHHRKGSSKQLFPIRETDRISIKGVETKKQTIINCLTARNPTRELHDTTIILSRHPRTGDSKKGGTGLLYNQNGNFYCLDTQNSQAILNNKGLRVLTENECEILQGYPKDWTAGVSRTQRYIQLGNSITVCVVEAIIKRYIEVNK